MKKRHLNQAKTHFSPPILFLIQNKILLMAYSRMFLYLFYLDLFCEESSFLLMDACHSQYVGASSISYDTVQHLYSEIVKRRARRGTLRCSGRPAGTQRALAPTNLRGYSTHCAMRRVSTQVCRRQCAFRAGSTSRNSASCQALLFKLAKEASFNSCFLHGLLSFQ